ncbi:Histidine kinase [Formosa sp. Hel1_31_208]|uniref:sensor histidine kinase n=1 Tax=Formosa sp. Hel1_31_208 TaxID=1798225 RepID=UPI00087B5461|nr:sensor histidine kinase [Formosa sp. Hel1_31_208]SDS21133.1 Histidine kinase [Formosa sp. Hel1_31_208]
MQNHSLSYTLKSSNYHRPLIFNSLLWLLAFVILIFVFSKGKAPITIDYIYTVGFLIFMTIPVSINFYLLMPKLLKHEKYPWYALAFVINLIVFANITLWLFQSVLDWLFPDYFFISYVSKGNLYITFTIFLISTTLLKLAEDWFYFNKSQNKLLKVKALQVETQLSSLRSQINPHFLFNSLNVIYALALEQKKETTKAIVELSDILRYVIYDSDKERVTLANEITLIQNYIAFQNYRVDTKNCITLDINIDNPQFKIYPMLILPLIENSFKYGLSPTENPAPIEVKITQKSNHLEFQINNANLHTKNAIDEAHSGVGLENLKNNLNLVYPNQHELIINDDKESFKVTMIINDDL